MEDWSPPGKGRRRRVLFLADELPRSGAWTSSRTSSPTPPATAVSTLTGTKTEVHQQRTYTGHRLAPWLGHIMVADQEVARPLLTPGEVLTLQEDELLLFAAGRRPVRARSSARRRGVAQTAEQFLVTKN
jgi:type IV secretory pathway TraG/TraD family ATPase VirD4